tara:strand:- start:183 stop:431 length:249 start_codon:yes stop_codon:yes gene_type:complete
MLQNLNRVKTLKSITMANFLMKQLAYSIECYDKKKINQVKVPISLENLRDVAKLLPTGMLRKFSAINDSIVNNTGLTEMEKG